MDSDQLASQTLEAIYGLMSKRNQKMFFSFDHFLRRGGVGGGGGG